MGLKINGTRFSAAPLRYFGGTLSSTRQLWGRTDLRNQSCGEGISDKTAGIPYGHRAPSAWNLPFKAGALSAFTNCRPSFTINTLNLVAGRNISGGASVTISVGPSQLDTIVSSNGQCVISFSVTGTVGAALPLDGSSSLSFTVGPSTLGAIVSAIGSSSVVFDDSATLIATGNMTGAITPFTELSPESLAAAVWNAISADFNLANTMGELLNSGGSGGGGGSGATPAQIWSYATRTLTASPGPSAATIASQVRSELTTELNRIDASISSRLPTASYTSPPTVSAIRAEMDTNSAKLDVAVGTRLASASYTAPPSAAANASAVRTELSTELGRIDVATSTRLATAGYTEPPTVSAIRTEIDTNSTKLDVAVSTRNAIAPDNAGIAAIKAKTDNLPANPASEGKVQEAVDAAKLAVALSA